MLEQMDYLKILLIIFLIFIITVYIINMVKSRKRDLFTNKTKKSKTLEKFGSGPGKHSYDDWWYLSKKIQKRSGFSPQKK